MSEEVIFLILLLSLGVCVSLDILALFIAFRILREVDDIWQARAQLQLTMATLCESLEGLKETISAQTRLTEQVGRWVGDIKASR
ncbi:MAG: hypothetical protein JW953_01475 [Anaerolineae bacterium]|nr:hypothetical protein [Anaerolineae bacterium]